MSAKKKTDVKTLVLAVLMSLGVGGFAGPEVMDLLNDPTSGMTFSQVTTSNALENLNSLVEKGSNTITIEKLDEALGTDTKALGNFSEITKNESPVSVVSIDDGANMSTIYSAIHYLDNELQGEVYGSIPIFEEKKVRVIYKKGKKWVVLIFNKIDRGTWGQ